MCVKSKAKSLYSLQTPINLMDLCTLIVHSAPKLHITSWTAGELGYIMENSDTVLFYGP